MATKMGLPVYVLLILPSILSVKIVDWIAPPLTIVFLLFHSVLLVNATADMDINGLILKVAVLSIVVKYLMRLVLA